ncbi:ribosome maturation factor RimM [Vannielia sp.]|uniref:ribosome maturation factor RimM n=1 Tax=Vannielia sp. TaxID=2813045 RepID=UPI00263827ED|nr:ribosome maturation factor RimM [Vannielia sp.]MDF1873888.1 ribosome maturation factor RimM [Vannielia sp.]
MSDDRVCVGVISGAFGVAGEVRLKSFCAEPSDIAEYGMVESEDGQRQYDITLTRPIKNAYAARLTGITTKEEADARKGEKLFVSRDVLPALPDDEYYHSDLIGLAVFDTGGVALGTVQAVHDHGAGDLLEVRMAGEMDTVLLPFTLEVVPTVDLAAGRVVVNPPEEV